MIRMALNQPGGLGAWIEKRANSGLAGAQAGGREPPGMDEFCRNIAGRNVSNMCME